MAQGFGQDIQKQSSRISQLKRKLDGSEDAEWKASYDLIRKAVKKLVRNRAKKNKYSAWHVVRQIQNLSGTYLPNVAE